jgi:hypothetical protein
MTQPSPVSSQFDRCPRCQGEWKPSERSFSEQEPTLMCQCGMQYCESMLPWINRAPRTVARTSFDRLMFLFEKHIVIWDFNSDGQVCIVANNNRTPGMSKYKLVPWLPYDITADKLKLYLTFS